MSFAALATKPNIRFATTGRRTGLRRERWWLPYAIEDDVIYLIEESPDALWLANIDADPHVEVGANGVDWIEAVARRVVDHDEQALARRLVGAKFGEGEWAFVRDGIVVALTPRR